MNPDLQVPLSSEELADIESAVAATTPGPWKWVSETHGWILVSDTPWRPTVMECVRRGLRAAQPRFPQVLPAGRPEGLADVPLDAHLDAGFIARARYVVPRLATEVRRCRAVMHAQDAELRRLRALLNQHASLEMTVVRAPMPEAAADPTPRSSRPPPPPVVTLRRR